MAAPSEDPRVGILVQGRYRIVRKLGEGGMGAVYEGKHEMIGRRVALKTLHPHFAQQPELVQRFHREANAATAVGNEHIIEVTDFGQFDDGAPYIVMEYLEGVELGELLDREGSLPISRVVHIITQVCDALAAAHARGIVHRDMKPENIYLIRRSNDPDFVKVLDFGISKVRADGDELKGALTKTGMALGTPYYMPPEQAQGFRDIDQRADVYAVGVIMYRALGGRLPFDAETYPALMVKIMTGTPEKLRAMRSDVPEALERFVLKAMAREREGRFQGVEDLALALQPFAAMTQRPSMVASVRPLGQTATPFVTDSPSQAPAGSTTARIPSTLPKLALRAGVFAAVGLLLAIMISRNSSEPPPVTKGAATPSAPVQTAPIAAPAPVAAPAPTSPPIAELPRMAEVRVHIDAVPQNARIFIAGAEFPNPTDAARPRSLDPLRIRIEAQGHQAQEQLAIFDQDRELHFELQKGEGTRELSKLDSRPGSRKPRPGDTTAPATPAPAPAAPAQSPTPKPSSPNDGLYQGPSGKIRDQF